VPAIVGASWIVAVGLDPTISTVLPAPVASRVEETWCSNTCGSRRVRKRFADVGIGEPFGSGLDLATDFDPGEE
jgi:hypothetical protein